MDFELLGLLDLPGLLERVFGFLALLEWGSVQRARMRSTLGKVGGFSI